MAIKKSTKKIITPQRTNNRRSRHWTCMV